MFKLSEKNQNDIAIMKCDKMRYSPSEISTIYTPNIQNYIIIARGYSVNGLICSFTDLNFDALQVATNDRYEKGN